MKFFFLAALTACILFIPLPAFAADAPALPLPSRQSFTVDGEPAAFAAINRYGKNFIKLAEIEELNRSRGASPPGDFPREDFILRFQGEDYYPITVYARDMNYFIAYNVDTDTVELDTAKPWPGKEEQSTWSLPAVKNVYVDASGQAVSRLYDAYRVEISATSSVSPTAADTGLTVTAQFEQHPHADVFKVTEYASPPGLPVDKVAVLNSGIQFSFLNESPNADTVREALEPVLNKNNAWSDEFVRRQREVFSVIINGENVNGFLEDMSLTNGKYDFYQFVFLETYETLEDIETIRIELNINQEE